MFGMNDVLTNEEWRKWNDINFYNCKTDRHGQVSDEDKLRLVHMTQDERLRDYLNFTVTAEDIVDLTRKLVMWEQKMKVAVDQLEERKRYCGVK